ncbi:MAG: HD domain-containing protein [Candidatus Cyclobacteriaceae bacterium M2_1C_046]
MSNNEKIVPLTVEYVKRELQKAEGGHDWWHIYRVWNNAKKVMAEETGYDPLVVELGALLHDIADSKFHNGDEEVGPVKAATFLQQKNIDQKVIDHVMNIIKYISFKGGNVKQEFSSKELDIVQDADRLDAIGAIGIARAFNYGGHKGRLLYDPEVKPNLKMTKEEYKHSSAPTINHFYEKLLLLKDRMNTKTGKRMAEERHRFMEEYLKQFYSEWEG